jgi:hypothetical protein
MHYLKRNAEKVRGRDSIKKEVKSVSNFEENFENQENNINQGSQNSLDKLFLNKK